MDWIVSASEWRRELIRVLILLSKCYTFQYRNRWPAIFAARSCRMKALSVLTFRVSRETICKIQWLNGPKLCLNHPWNKTSWLFCSLPNLSLSSIACVSSNNIYLEYWVDLFDFSVVVKVVDDIFHIREDLAVEFVSDQFLRLLGGRED